MLSLALRDDQKAKNEAVFSYQFSYQFAHGTGQEIRNFSPVHSVRDRGVGGSNPLAPTNSSENLQNPGCQVTRFLSRIPFAEPSARCFKSGFHAESFEISRLRRSRLVYPAHFSKQSATLRRYPTARSDTDSRS
jgi:hypothetical protein